MIIYVLRRLAGAVVTLFVIITISFFLMRVAPGGPFDRERPLDPTVQANLERAYHLDQPLMVQYGYYLKGLIRGDLGPSFIYRDFSVSELFAQGLPVSVKLGASALAIALGFGCLLGVFASLRQNGLVDYAVMTLAALGITIPNFVIAPLLTLGFALQLDWLPAGGWNGGALANTVLPVVSLALPYVATIARLTRGSMIEALRSHHIRTVRANGLPMRVVVLAHAFRGAILPVVSYLGPAAAGILTGSVVIETIFGIPGVGRYFVQGALNRDYTLVMGTVVMIAVFVIVFNLAVDLIYAALDPRVRYE